VWSAAVTVRAGGDFDGPMAVRSSELDWNRVDSRMNWHVAGRMACIEAERCRQLSCRNNRPADWSGAQVSDRACPIYPAPRVVARVLTAGVPTEPPPQLASFVVPVMEEGAVADWLLTTDSIAFGPHDLATEFKDWRGTWQESWELDPVQGFQRLLRLVVDAGAINEPSQRLAEKFALTSLSIEESVLSPSRSVLIPELVERARSLAAAVETMSVGLVDTTDDAVAAGLLAGWPLSSTTKLLARDQYSCVQVHRRRRLCWDWIVADPSDSALCEWGPDAATLMSPLVGQLLDVAHRNPNRYAVTVATLAVRVEEIGRCIVELERAIDAEPRGSQQGVELGRILYDPAGSALTNQPTHLPARVGTLTSPRVATLLGERQEVTFPLAG